MQSFVQIIKRFGWTWVGLVLSEGELGLQYARMIRSGLERFGACLAYVEFMRGHWSVLQRIVTTMKESSARVVIYLAEYLNFVMEADNQWAEGVRYIFIS